jgi:hypothetical protein
MNNIVRFVSIGTFANRVGGLLQKHIDLVDASDDSSDAYGDGRTILVSDSFNPSLARGLSGVSDSIRLSWCFLSTRGLFVSCWLTPSGPCLGCFEKRWYANLDFWEHSSDQERRLQKLEALQSEVRSFPLAASAAFIAAESLLSLVRGDYPQRLCTYVDLVSCRLTQSTLHPVSNCEICDTYPDSTPGRYLRDLRKKLYPVRLRQ